MLHKLRSAMGKRDGQYQLSGQIELDEGFFSTAIAVEAKDKPLKRVRGSQKKTKVLVMVESKFIEGKTTKKGKPHKAGYLEMQVIPNLKADTINEQVVSGASGTATLTKDRALSSSIMHK